MLTVPQLITFPHSGSSRLLSLTGVGGRDPFISRQCCEVEGINLLQIRERSGPLAAALTIRLASVADLVGGPLGYWKCSSFA